MKKLILLAAVASALFSSCQKNSNPAPDAKNVPGGFGAKSRPALTTDVYILGTTQGANASNGYLKNGTFVAIPTPPLGGQTFDIAVSGSDVYIAATALTATTSQAYYYKNGVIHYLTYGTTANFASEGFAIAASDTDVYVVGDYVDFDRRLTSAMLWKNGVPQNLSYNIYPSGARAVAVDHGILYVAGYSQLDAGSGDFIATFWKNGAHGRVRSSKPISWGASLSFNRRGDFYVGGSAYSNPLTDYISAYWFDSVVEMIVPVETGTNPPIPYLKNGEFAYAHGIGNNFVTDVKYIGDDVYVVGKDMSGVGGVFYKNGVQVPLPAGFTPKKICLVQH